MSAIATELRRRVSKNIAPIGTSGEYAYSSPQALMVPETVNEAEMSAEFVIVSNVEDREYDVITPQGCEEHLDEYRRNPVVLLEHDCLKPVGLSTDKSGTFHFRISADRIVAKCFFHCLPLNGENLSEEVFRLVTKGVFRGASPGFLPVRGRKRGYGKDDGYEYHQWRLTEWSITSQPVNQDALRMSLGGVRCKSLRRTLESLVIKPSPVVRGGFVAIAGPDAIVTVKTWPAPPGVKAMKPKTASIEFDRDIFTTEAAAVAWLDAHGQDSSTCTPLPGSFIFKQRDGKPIAGRKSLGKGVVALLTKAFGKKDDDDDEKKKKKKPADEKPDEMTDKVEKADDAPEEDDDDDDSDDVEDSDAEGDEDGDESKESEEAEVEAIAEAENVDPEALKAEAKDLANVVTHFKTLIAALPEMAGRATKASDHYAKLMTDAQTIIDDLGTVFSEHFAGVALDAMADTAGDEPAATPEPAPDAPTDEYKDVAKTLAAARKDMDAAKRTAKSLPRLAVA